MAEGEGFEPSVRFPVQRFSRWMDWPGSQSDRMFSSGPDRRNRADQLSIGNFCSPLCSPQVTRESWPG